MKTEITFATKDYTKRDIFKMTHNSVSLKDVGEGERITVVGYASVLKVDESTGDTNNILFIETEDFEGKRGWIATTSNIVERELAEIWEAYYDGSNTVEVEHVIGMSKAGRAFHNLRVVD